MDRGRHPVSKYRDSRLYCLRSEGESGVLVGVCKNACAVTLAALGSQSRSSTAPSRPDAPTKLDLLHPRFYPAAARPTPPTICSNEPDNRDGSRSEAGAPGTGSGEGRAREPE